MLVEYVSKTKALEIMQTQIKKKKKNIDALLYAKKPITRQALDIYQNNLNNYTDNKQAKIKILEIATTNAYTEFAWSMKIYEKDYRGNGTFIGVRQNRTNGIDPNSSF